MTSNEIREKFLEFFKKNGHKIVPSSSLLTADPTVLFTTAGMQQFKPYYLSEKSPYGDNVTTSQKCLRFSDIKKVGDESHLTFFEMLGNFSFGGYFKEKAIKLAKDFLDELNIKIDYVTVFEGDENTPRDEESAKIWRKLGFSEEKGNLRFENKEENFWGPTGGEGPCGPTTEVYSGGIEIWNIVFNQYYSKNGKLEPLKTPGIDTGMGLERLAKVMQEKDTVFETDLFAPIMSSIMSSVISIIGDKPVEKVRIIADHLKAATFLIANGVEPSNMRHGYVLRKLIRRAMLTHYKFIGAGLDVNFFRAPVEVVINIYKSVYPELSEKRDEILEKIGKETEKFEKTLEKGLKILSQELKAQDMGPKGEIKPSLNLETVDGFLGFTPGEITGKWLFNFYQTFGFPMELSLEEVEKNLGRDLTKFEIDKLKREFKKELEKHQELSRTASAGMFKGGLADSGEETKKLHTAAHLMLAGLRKVLGEHVVQKGSNITSERLRFDFSHKEKMTKEQIKDIENFVNNIIKKDLPVVYEEMSLEQAKELNAMGVFESKYGDKVKVYTVGEEDNIVSREICGGPHVERTGILGKFKIKKEESSGAGVRRIRAILE